MLNSIIQVQEFQNLEQNKMILEYKKAFQHIEQLNIQIDQLEKSAIDIIVEKDQIIDQLERQLQNSSRRPSLNNFEEVTTYKNHIQELQNRLDSLQIKNFEQLQEQEKIWNQYLLDQLALNEQTVDQKLKGHLEQIFILEEKITKLENDVDMKENAQISLNNQIKQLKEQNVRLEEQQLNLNRMIFKLQIELEQTQLSHQKEKSQYTDQIKQISQELTELKQQTNTFYQQNQKLNNQNKVYTDTISELMTKKAELEILVSTSFKFDKQESIGNGKTTAFTGEQQIDNYFVREDINTTAFDLNEETTDVKQELASFKFDENDVNFNYLKKSPSNFSLQSEKIELNNDIENHLKKAIKTIKQQNALIQLINSQLKIYRRININTNNAKDYLLIMEQNYNASLNSKQSQIKILEDKISLQSKEIMQLKYKLKEYGQKIIKYSKRQQNISKN